MPYILAIVLSGGVIAYLIESSRKPKKINPLSEREKIIIKEKVRSMNGRDFEIFTAKIYSLLGYKPILTPASNDKGRDIIINENGEKIYVECKHNIKKNTVGRPEAQKLCGAMVSNNIAKGIILTFNGANKNCLEYCRQVKGKQVKIESIKVINLIDLLEECTDVDSNEILEILGLENIKFLK